MNPEFSVIVNCKNGERYLKEALDSIYNQTFQDWEVIFFDNNSSDSSRDIANSYDFRLKIHQAKEDMNLGKARNKAINLCKGNFVCFLDVDDVFLPMKLENQLKIFKRKAVKLVSGGINIINENSKVLRVSIPDISNQNAFVELLKEYQLFMPAVAIDLKYMKENNHNFDEFFFHSPDYKLFMSIAQETDIYVSDEIFANYRIHDSNLSLDMRKVMGTEWINALEYLQSPERAKFKYKGQESAFRNVTCQARILLALEHLNKGLRWKSIKEILSISPKTFKAIVLLMLLFMPISSSFLLKIIYFGSSRFT